MQTQQMPPAAFYEKNRIAENYGFPLGERSNAEIEGLYHWQQQLEHQRIQTQFQTRFQRHTEPFASVISRAEFYKQNRHAEACGFPSDDRTNAELEALYQQQLEHLMLTGRLAMITAE